MHEQNDRDLDFLLKSYDVDETSERMHMLEQKIMDEIAADTSTPLISVIPDRWVQILSASTVLTALALVLVSAPLRDDPKLDIYSLYASGSYLLLKDNNR